MPYTATAEDEPPLMTQAGGVLVSHAVGIREVGQVIGVLDLPLESDYDSVFGCVSF